MQGLRDRAQGLRQGLPQHPEPESGHQVTFLNITAVQSPSKHTWARSVGELVQFYYLWKKTERHDVFANRYRNNVHKNCLLTICSETDLELRRRST